MIKSKVEILNLLQKYNIQYVFHMTHIRNLKSILENGLLPHGNNFQKKDISDNNVNNRRSKKEPIFNKEIHSYVPFYFNPKNAMLYKRKEMQSDIVIIVMRKEIFLKSNIIISDGNASCYQTKFYNSLNDLSHLNWNCLKDNSWNNHIDGKRVRMAELLVPQKVQLKYISAILINNDFDTSKIKNIKMPKSIKLYKDSTNRFFFKG
jgi:hypothetical protein